MLLYMSQVSHFRIWYARLTAFIQRFIYKWLGLKIKALNASLMVTFHLHQSVSFERDIWLDYLIILPHALLHVYLLNYHECNTHEFVFDMSYSWIPKFTEKAATNVSMPQSAATNCVTGVWICCNLFEMFPWNILEYAGAFCEFGNLRINPTQWEFMNNYCIIAR